MFTRMTTFVAPSSMGARRAIAHRILDLANQADPTLAELGQVYLAEFFDPTIAQPSVRTDVEVSQLLARPRDWVRRHTDRLDEIADRVLHEDLLPT